MTFSINATTTSQSSHHGKPLAKRETEYSPPRSSLENWSAATGKRLVEIWNSLTGWLLISKPFDGRSRRVPSCSSPIICWACVSL